MKIFEEFVRLQEKNAAEGIIEEDESDDEEEDEDDKEDEVEGEVSLLGSHSSNGSDIENLSESENEDEIDDNEDDMHEEEIEPQLGFKKRKLLKTLKKSLTEFLFNFKKRPKVYLLKISRIPFKWPKLQIQLHRPTVAKKMTL